MATMQTVQKLEKPDNAEPQADKQAKKDSVKKAQTVTVSKTAIMQTTAKSKSKKKPTPVGSIAEALKRKRQGSGIGLASSQSSTDRVIDASFWVRRLKTSARNQASSAYDPEVESNAGKGSSTKKAKQTHPQLANRNVLSQGVQATRQADRQNQSKRAAYTLALVLAHALVIPLWQICYHHSGRRIYTFLQRTWTPSNMHGAWWTNNGWLHTYLCGTCHNIWYLCIEHSLLAFDLLGRSILHLIHRQPLRGAWTWLWCNDDNQTWNVTRYTRGAYKASNRIFRHDAPSQLIMMTYVLFLIICVEITIDIAEEIRTRLDNVQQGLPCRTASNMFHFGAVFRTMALCLFKQSIPGARKRKQSKDYIHTWNDGRHAGTCSAQACTFRFSDLITTCTEISRITDRTVPWILISSYIFCRISSGYAL